MGYMLEINKILRKWGFLIVLFLATFLAIIVVVNNDSKKQLNAGEVAPKTYIATRDVENEIATKRNQELAKAEVQTVYIIDESKNQEIFKRSEEFFTQVDYVRAVYNINKEQYLRKLEEFENSKNEEGVASVPAPSTTEEEILSVQVDKIMATFLDMEYDIKNLVRADFEYLLEMPKTEYETIKVIVDRRVKVLTQSGVTISAYDKGDFYSTDSTEVSVYESMLINDIISVILEPNVSVDVAATQEAMNKAVEKVQPVMYLKGQTIVTEGEVITEEQLQILVKLNLIGSVKDLGVGNIIAYLVIVGIVYAIIGLVFAKDHSKKFMANNYKLMFVSINLLMLLGLVIIPKEYSLYSPLFILSFILANLFNNFIAFLMSIVYITLYALLGRVAPIEILYLLLTSTLTAVIVTVDIQRFRVVKVSLLISFVSGLIYVLLNVIFRFEAIPPLKFLTDVVIVISFVLVSSIFANGVIPFLEASFNLLTTHGLQELINQEKPIFKRMLAETPGTLHHSLIVANLCEAGAKAIKADAMLAKAYGYYHDIGKLSAPMYFIENQTGYNFHDDLECSESARIITNHVEYGLQVRKEYKLPRFLDDAILTHHGNSVLQYFYRKAKDIEKQENIDIEDYTYTGYIPNSKELTILMLADIVEAGVRSIIPKVSDFKEVEEFIDKVIDGKMKEGQFNDSNLTFSDIAKVKAAFIVVLKGMYHNRITYPAQK